jgi:glutathione S-transferase
MMQVLFVKLILSRVPLLGRVAVRTFQPMVDVHVNYVESELADRPCFAGDSFTAADVMMSLPLEAARSRARISSATHPYIFKWLGSIHARPA